MNCFDEHRWRYSAVNIAVGFVNSFLVGGEGGDAGGICSLNDGVEVEGWGWLTVGVITEVGKVESRTAVHSTDAGDELTYFHLEPHSVDVDDIVGTGLAGGRCRLTWNNVGIPNLLPCYLGGRQKMSNRGAKAIEAIGVI